MPAGRHQVLGRADAPLPQRTQAGVWRSGGPSNAPACWAGRHSPLPLASDPLAPQSFLSARWQSRLSRRQPAFPRGREPVLPPWPLPEPHGAARRAHLPAHVVPPFRMPPRSPGFARAVPGVAGGTGHRPTHIPLRPFSTNEEAKPKVGLHAEGHDFDSKSSAAFLCHHLQMTTTNLPGESELYD